MNRAYSILTVKAVDDDQRIIEGVATTPEPDRVGDIVEPLGVKFKNPMPLLWQHKSDKPVGLVKFDKPTKEGITFRAELPKVAEAGALKDRVDEAWQSVKHGLVRAVSIGFRSIEHSFMDDGGIRFVESEVMELSLVTIPANADATITAIKSIDADLLAATGRKPNDDDRPKKPAGASATKSTKVVRAQEGPKMKTLTERIKDMESTRAAKAARMDEIQNAADGRTKDAAEKEEFDGLKADIKAIDDELVDLRDMEKINLAKAVPAKGGDADEASRARSGEGREAIRVQVRGGNVPKGIGFVRLLAARTNAYLSKGQFSPLDFVKGRPHWQSETPEVEQVLKAAVSAGTTTDSTWAAPLAQYTNLASEFVEYLRPLTIIGRIQGMRRVPFLVKFPRQTGAAVASWVGQAKPKPATSLAFDSLTLDPLKVAGIVPISMELMRLSSPSAEAIIRDDLAGAIAQLVDHDFLDPEKAASANVSPASLTYGLTPVAATGTTFAYLKADVKSVMANFFAANITPDTVVMKQSTAQSLGMMETSLGNQQFPGLDMNGGKFFGMNVVTSQNMDYTEDSPQEGDNIIFLRANDIALADDGGVEVDVSTEASIEMSTTPTDPSTASVELISLWQRNLVGIRAERMVNWVKRRSAAVQYISKAAYV